MTEFFRGVEAEHSVGERAPDHRLELDGEPIAEVRYPVAEDQTVRYAAASGDDFAIHLDDEFAQKVGLPGRIVHGLCTMAFAGRAVLEAAGVDDPRAVKRLAVRFSAPLFPGETVTTRVWRVDGGYGFESLNGEGKAVIKDGLVELAMTIDVDNVVAIDVHTHAEVGRTGEDGLRPEWRAAAAKYFGEDGNRRPSRTSPPTTASATWRPSSSPSTR